MRAGWTITGLLCPRSGFGPGAAHAEDPVTFGKPHRRQSARSATARRDYEALDRLFADTQTDLVVVYVDSFSNPEDRVAWADETATRNGLGTNDVLLAVATGERQYQLSVAAGFALSDAQLQEIETVAIEPALRESLGRRRHRPGQRHRREHRQLARGHPDVTPGEAGPRAQ
jgi:hypothetical protein